MQCQGTIESHGKVSSICFAWKYHQNTLERVLQKLAIGIVTYLCCTLTDGNKLVVFSSILLYYGDTYISLLSLLLKILLKCTACSSELAGRH